MLRIESSSNMKWVGISGSWRTTNKKVESDVKRTVRSILKGGNGIVSGGALGVDYIATSEALKRNPSADRLKIYLPTSLDKYAEHYQRHALVGTITTKQAKDLIIQLEKIKTTNPESIIENLEGNFSEATKQHEYYERNSRVVEASDALVAFRVKTRVSESMGTGDTIEKAKKKGIPVRVYSYDLTAGDEQIEIAKRAAA